MAQATMKEDALPQIYFVRDTDLGMFAYELHILAGDFLRESEFNLHSLAANTGPDSIAIMGKIICGSRMRCLPTVLRRSFTGWPP